jgi:hypothetical protein
MEGFLSFNASAVAGSASVGTLSLYGADAFGLDTAFTTEARAHPWSSGNLTTADWVAGASLSALTRLATRASAGFTTSGYNAFTSDVAMLAAIDAHGTLDMLLCSARQTAGTAPSDGEYLEWISADASGTAQDPKIDITTIDAGGAKLALNSYRRRRV